MENHSNHNTEQKPVAFTVPLILAAVTIFIIVLFLSLCNPKHGHASCECDKNCGKECMEACEKGDHSKHPSVANENNESKNELTNAEDSDSTKINHLKDTLAHH